MALEIFPCTLKQANLLVGLWHRHHKPVVGHRFSVGVMEYETGKVCGVAIAGRPVSREIDQYNVLEITRLVTDGTKNSCSFLYSAIARIAREMGYRKIQTYILEEEQGTSLLASGWSFEGKTAGGDWNCNVRKDRRQDQPMNPKKRYGKTLNKREIDPIFPEENIN